jgi:hypothetical protein
MSQGHEMGCGWIDLGLAFWLAVLGSGESKNQDCEFTITFRIPGSNTKRAHSIDMNTSKQEK